MQKITYPVHFKIYPDFKLTPNILIKLWPIRVSGCYGFGLIRVPGLNLYLNNFGKILIREISWRKYIINIIIVLPKKGTLTLLCELFFGRIDDNSPVVYFVTAVVRKIIMCFTSIRTYFCTVLMPGNVSTLFLFYGVYIIENNVKILYYTQ